MASAGENAAIDEAEPAGGSKVNRRRISDYLGDSDGGEDEALPPYPETPPQLRLPRFTCARLRFVRFGKKRSDRKEVPVATKTEDASVDSAAGSKRQAETSTSGNSASGEAAAGMGLSMLFLLAVRTCVELNRMAEVRAQMEALLKEIRDEANRVKVAVTHPTRSFNLQLSSSATVPSSSCTSDTDTNHHHGTTSSNAVEIAGYQERESMKAEGDQRLDLGAAEFEAEPPQHRSTVECNSEQETCDESTDDEFIELDDGGRFCGGSSGDLKWDAEDDDSEEESTTGAQDEGGVCAIELERRLHELRHRRNRERIEELESALRRTEQKLREKEMEARLWQDTATLALQPPPRDGL